MKFDDNVKVTELQKKVSKLLQKDVAEILQTKVKKEGNYGILLSVTKVSVTVDFSVAKVFLSVFPSEMSKQILDEVVKMSSRIRHEVAQKAKKQLRKVKNTKFQTRMAWGWPGGGAKPF